ncbi:NADH-quinone oxidoreductase subunit G [Fodinicola feengrottensis]
MAPEKVDTVTCSIDGIDVTVPKGTLVIRAAEQIGVQIPRFCDHPLLEPAGACRQCMVEVSVGGRPMPKPQASCTLACSDGMVVKTQLTSPVAEKAQRGTLEMLLINHPLDCPICDKGGECPLQNQTLANGDSDSRFLEQKRTFPKPIAISSQVLLDRERCVLCQRCTRFSDQIAGDKFIDLLERGANQQIGIDQREPFQSYFSGNTVQICPVGALTGAAYRFRARPFDLVSTDSVCEHCSGGCAQRTDWRRNKVTRRLAGDDPEVNEEWNCDKGRWAFTYATADDRLTSPLVRNEKGELVAASWTEAFEKAAEGLREARDNGRGVGVLTGGRLTYEDSYAYSKFARAVLGTNDIDFRTGAHSDEELSFLATRVLGVTPENGGVTYRKVESAPAVLLVGLEAEEESPILFLRLRKAWRKKGLRLFSVAPYRTRGLAKAGGTLLEAVPGAEPLVLNALAGGKTGAHDLVGQASEALREPGAIILVGARLAASPGALTAAARLATATGAQLAWVARRAGDRGAVQAGALPTLLPGGAAVSDDDARAELERTWGLDAGALPGASGRSTVQIIDALHEGALSGVIVAGVDTADLPDPAAAEAALEAAGFVVSLELRESAVTRRADVVFPVAAAAEKAGTFLNWEGRSRPFPATLPAAGTLPDAAVLDELAEELIGEAAPLDLANLQTLRAQLTALPEPGPRAVTVPKAVETAAPTPSAGEAVLATWTQNLDNGRLQDNEPHLAGTAKVPVARISAGTAAEIGVANGGNVRVSTDAGSITLPVLVTPMPDRVVWLPTNSPGSTVRRSLAVGAGAVVRLAAGLNVEGEL